jgi:hypothetical protein
MRMARVTSRSLLSGSSTTLRRLLELQAIRRMEAGSLTPEQEEALGTTLMRARERVLELARQFELNEADLRLDLGPLGRLM